VSDLLSRELSRVTTAALVVSSTVTAILVADTRVSGVGWLTYLAVALCLLSVGMKRGLTVDRSARLSTTVGLSVFNWLFLFPILFVFLFSLVLAVASGLVPELTAVTSGYGFGVYVFLLLAGGVSCFFAGFLPVLVYRYGTA
jgi:hypothetical protein